MNMEKIIPYFIFSEYDKNISMHNIVNKI